MPLGYANGYPFGKALVGTASVLEFLVKMRYVSMGIARERDRLNNCKPARPARLWSAYLLCSDSLEETRTHPTLPGQLKAIPGAETIWQRFVMGLPLFNVGVLTMYKNTIIAEIGGRGMATILIASPSPFPRGSQPN